MFARGGFRRVGAGGGRMGRGEGEGDRGGGGGCWTARRSIAEACTAILASCGSWSYVDHVSTGIRSIWAGGAGGGSGL